MKGGGGSGVGIGGDDVGGGGIQLGHMRVANGGDAEMEREVWL